MVVHISTDRVNLAAFDWTEMPCKLHLFFFKLAANRECVAVVYSPTHFHEWANETWRSLARSALRAVGLFNSCCNLYYF